MHKAPTPRWTREQICNLYPELTEAMTDFEINEFVADLNEDEEEMKQPFFARALDTGRLPVIAVVIVALLSVAGMLAAAAFYTPGVAP